VSDLRENLDQMLRTVDPGPAPVDAVVRRGKRIRTRRRLITGACAVAVVAFAVAGYPALTHEQAAPAPTPVTHRPSVTDIPPGPGAPKNLLASGMINGTPWKVVSEQQAKQQCFVAYDPGWRGVGAVGDCERGAPGAARPVAFQGFEVGGRDAVTIGTVRADVQYVLITLADGTQLKLIPVAVHGRRYVAFPSAGAVPVASATVYVTSGGQGGTAIPFNAPDGVPMFAAWLQPGQHQESQLRQVVAADSSPGQPWSLTAYAGPWGICLVESGATGAVTVSATTCLDAAPRVTEILGSFGGGLPQVFYGSATAVVSQLQITLSDGSVIQVVPVQVGDAKLFAFACGGMSVTKIAETVTARKAGA
jgi:hypothetical protein